VDRGQLGLTTAADHGHDAIALLETSGAGAGGDDLAGELEPRNVRRRTGGRWVEAAPLHHVGAVQAGRLHPYEDFAGARLRVRMLLDDNLVVTHDHCLHVANDPA
jgi:hypothetical protein